MHSTDPPLPPHPPPINGAETATTTTAAPKRRRTVHPGGKKRGPKPGSKFANTKTFQDWYHCCHTFRNLTVKMNRTAFLSSHHSGPQFTGTKSEQQSFGRYLQKYDTGMLKPSTKRRHRTGPYDQVQTKLLQFLNQQSTHYRRNRCGLSWDMIKQKSKGYATELGLFDFTASDGWVSNTLKKLDEPIMEPTTAAPQQAIEPTTTLEQALQLVQRLERYNERVGLNNESRYWLTGYANELRSHCESQQQQQHHAAVQE